MNELANLDSLVKQPLKSRWCEKAVR